MDLNLGKVGVWSGRVARLPGREAAEVAKAVEDLGFRTLWFPESFGKEAMSLAGFLLASTTQLIVATGIANIWARDATAMINGARTLMEAYPGRLLLGLGVSHAPSVGGRGHAYRRPVEAMIRYLDAMDTATYWGPAPELDPPVVLAALGPRMLELAARRTLGAHPYFVPIEHTVVARDSLGEGPLLAPEQALVLETDPEVARETARRHTARYLALDNYRNNLSRLGWADPDLAEAGSDGLVDAVVAWGDRDALASRVFGHLAAGADHVSVQILDGPADRFPVESLRSLAEDLLSV